MKKQFWKNPVFWLMLAGCLFRLCGILNLHAKVNQDETFAAYESWALGKYGTDLEGYHFPVYFAAWGSGMNILLSVIAIPFTHILGPCAAAVRIPMYILSCCSLPAYYLIGKKLKNQNLGLMFLLCAACSPSLILLADIGIDSYLSGIFIPWMICLGLYIKDGIRYGILWGLCLVLTAYSYAAEWPFLAIYGTWILISSLHHKNKETSISAATGALTAITLCIPLFLLFPVNTNRIPEIRGLISIPKLQYWRSGETKPASIILQNIIFITGITDSAIQNHWFIYGMPVITAFAGWTIFLIKNRHPDPEFTAFPYSMLISLLFVTIAKGGKPAMFSIFGSGLLLDFLIQKAEHFRVKKAILWTTAGILCLNTLSFSIWYSNDIRTTGENQEEKCVSCTDVFSYADAVGSENVYVVNNASMIYPFLLCHDRISPEKARSETDRIAIPKTMDWQILKYRNYVFAGQPGILPENIHKYQQYIILKTDRRSSQKLESAGYQRKTFQYYAYYYE